MEWFGDYGIDEGDLDQGEGYDSAPSAQRDAVVFLIDCSAAMLKKMREGDDLCVQQCLKCAKNVQQNKIISSDKDVTGIVLYGTKLSSSADMKNIYILQTLGQPDAARILQLERVISLSKQEFGDEFGSNQPYSLADALWTCLDMFSRSSHKLGFKRVFLFTNEDNPHADQLHLRRQAAMKMNDLRQNNADLELINMEPQDHHPFSLEPFYKDLLIMDDDEITSLPDSAQRFDELLSRVRAKDHKKRALSSIPFNLGGSVAMQVGVYSLVNSCRVPTAVKLDKRTNEELRRQSRKLLSSTAEMLMPQDLKKSLEIGTKRIFFENDEVANMKKLTGSGLRLLGFKPRSFLKTHYHKRPSHFIYPDEKKVEGSTTLFTALLQKCLDRNVIALCHYVFKEGSLSNTAALLPQAEVKDKLGAQERPPGFHVIFLPYSDDIRKLTFPTLEKASTEAVDAAKEIVKKLTTKFDPENFENPKLQTFYVNLEALALDRDEPEKVDDHTEPNSVRIKMRAGEAIESLMSAVDWVAKSPRKRGGGADAKASGKRSRTDDGEAIDLGEVARSGRLPKLSVVVLRQEMQAAKIAIPSGARKQDLIDKILSHYGVP